MHGNEHELSMPAYLHLGKQLLATLTVTKGMDIMGGLGSRRKNLGSKGQKG